jgi:hypothetical protein
MPRVIHKPVFGIVQHVISRFVNGQRLMDRDEIRYEYLSRLRTVLTDSDWLLLWYALMETHVHLALVAGRSTLSSWIQPLHTGFAVWSNLLGRRRGLKTRGPVFAGPPKTVNFSDDKAGYLAAYLHNNPVRAGIVQNAADTTWTSHRAYIGLDPAPDFLHVNRGLALTGNEDSAQGRLLFHDYVVSRSGDLRESRLSGGEIAAVRNAERRQLGPIVEMYSPYLASEISRYETRFVPEAHVRRTYDGDTRQFLHLVAETTGVSVSQMRSRCRDRQTVSARRTAVMAWRILNRQTSEIAASLSIGVAAATQLARRNANQDFEAERNITKVLTLFNNQTKIST